MGPEGYFDLPASKRALATLAAACRKRGIDHAIVDLRAVQPVPKPAFTTSDLLALVNAFPEAGFTKRLRLAIIYRSDPHKRARLFAFISTLHGWNVHAFADFEHAVRWLNSGPPVSDEECLGASVRVKSRSAPFRKRLVGVFTAIRSRTGRIPRSREPGRFARGHQ